MTQPTDVHQAMGLARLKQITGGRIVMPPDSFVRLEHWSGYHVSYAGPNHFMLHPNGEEAITMEQPLDIVVATLLGETTEQGVDNSPES